MKKLLIILIILAVLGTGGWFGYQQYQKQQEVKTLSGLQFYPVKRGNLIATVGATGQVRSNQSALLLWQTSGSVETVKAQTGDQVSANQTLASLAQTSLAQNVILAQADLINAQKALDNLYDTNLATAQAKQNVANAQKALEDAQKRSDSIDTRASQGDIDAARSNAILAKNQLDRAYDQYKPYENKAEDNVIRASLLSKYAAAQQKYDGAVQRLNNLLGTSSDTTVAIIKANLDLAQAQLTEAKKQVDKLKNGPEAGDITVAKTRIAAAQAALNLQYLVAPFAGTITEVKVKSGDQISPGAVAFRMDDLSRLLVDVEVSEVDINRVRINQEATLSFDAIPGNEYKGVVVEIDTVGTQVQGVVDFMVTIELSNADDNVRPGMTAAASFIVEQINDILLVPNRAVRLKNNQRVIYIVENNVLVEKPIKLGASSDSISQLLEGELKEGDQIVLNPPLEFDTNSPPPFVQR